MPPTIYKKQKTILQYLQQYIHSNGYAPTLKEIAEAIGVSSLATVHEHLSTLEEKGMIKRRHGKTRGIDFINENLDFIREKVIQAPILGYIAAGAPIEAYSDPNATISIAPSFVSDKQRIYVLQVRGESMIDEQIRDGDYVVIEETDEVRDGEIVVALLDNGMATLKRFFREATRVRLEPANAKMSPIFVKNVRIQGRVVGLIRRFVVN